MLNKKVEESLDMMPASDLRDIIDDKEVISNSKETKQELVDRLSAMEKLDVSSPNINGLEEHEEEMNQISAKAMQSFKDLMDLGLQVNDNAAGRMFEVAATMLKIAHDSSSAKADRKLKILDMLMKKAKLDNDVDPSKGQGGDGVTLDREEILKQIRDAAKNES